MKKAMIVWGGWDGHQPKESAEVFRRVLEQDRWQVQVFDTLEAFENKSMVLEQDLIVPHWTMGKISKQQAENVCEAVRGGVGIAGCHGGMCDAFREATEWQFMTGGQWVAHPGNDGVDYTVKIAPTRSPITEGLEDFHVKSEQYYMHVDPAVKVLAYTEFPVVDGPHVGNGHVDMPVVWTKVYGKGKVFYSSLGHQANIIESEPALTIMRRGFQWAAR